MISRVSMAHVFSYLNPAILQKYQNRKVEKNIKCLSDNKMPPHDSNVEIIFFKEIFFSSSSDS